VARVLPVSQVQAEDSITFAVISDYGICSTGEQNVATMVNGWNPGFIVTAGDNWQGADMDGGGACDTYAEAVGTYYGTYVTNDNLLPSPGNHDYYADNPDGLNHYRAYFTYIPTDDDSSQRYYDFVQGDAHFFMIDSAGMINTSTEAVTDQALYDAQYAWLQSGLINSTAKWQIVVFHFPPYSSSSSHYSMEPMRWPFATWGADAVLSGHNHVYERVMQNGIPYFTVGLGGQTANSFGTVVNGSAVRYRSNYGAMKVTATDTDLTFQFLSLGNTLQDTYTLTQEPTPTPTATETPPAGLFGDMDADCDVDVVDIMLVAGRWSSSVGDPGYDARYDLDGNGTIDIVDIMLVAGQWNTHC
jgi:hypothetical protein